MKKTFIFLLLVSIFSSSLYSQYISKLWISDLGNGRYRNPVIYADYPDLDVCRVKDTYYMISSSYSYIPGLPILSSKDLVNWEITDYVITADNTRKKHTPFLIDPSIRYQNEYFYVYYVDTEKGIYMSRTKELGKWEKPKLIIPGKNLAYPCPIWENDKCYLSYGYKDNTEGVKNLIFLCELSIEGDKYLGNNRSIYDANSSQENIDGVKIIKERDFYFLTSSSESLKRSSSLICLRATNIYGPYEKNYILNQGRTSTDGPYKGGMVETEAGEFWFLFSQPLKSYGKIVHLNPIHWDENWPFVGSYINKDKCGEPLTNHKKPKGTEKININTPVESDDFSGEKIGLQWQWSKKPL